MTNKSSMFLSQNLETAKKQVKAYLMREHGMGSQEAEGYVQDHEAVVEKGMRMASYSYFVGDQIMRLVVET